jgi:uncharacterized protein (AIM24 family)
VLTFLGWGLGYFGQPHILARFMAVRSADELDASRRIAVIWVTVALGAATLVGLAGAAWLDPGGREITVLELKDEEVYLVETALLAFGAGLAWENGRLPEESGADLDIVHLRGAGLIALVSARTAFALDVREQPMTVASDRLVGWSGALVPSRGSLPGLPSTVKRPSVVRFEGTGRVLVV